MNLNNRNFASSSIPIAEGRQARIDRAGQPYSGRVGKITAEYRRPVVSDYNITYRLEVDGFPIVDENGKPLEFSRDEVTLQ